MTLSEYLNTYGVSVSELSRRLGVSRQSIYNWMRGTHGPHVKHGLQIARVTEGKVDVLGMLYGAVPSLVKESHNAAA